MYELLACNKLK